MKKKLLLCLILFVTTNVSFAQTWVRLPQVPKTDVFSLTIQHDTVYAGTLNKVYIGSDVSKNWKVSAAVPGAGYISSIVILNSKIYVSLTTNGVFSSSNQGDSWVAVNDGLSLTAMSKLLVWNGKLYGATQGEGFFVYNESTNRWAAFNNGFYTNVDGGVHDVEPAGSTIVAGAGANGIFYIYDTTINSWRYTYYNNGRLSPGLWVNVMQADGNSIFSGINGTFSQALLRSDDGGDNWATDTVGLGAYLGFNEDISGVDALAAGVKKNYLVINSFRNGINAARIFERNRGSVRGAKWHLAGGFTDDHFMYTLAEAGDKLFVALDSGLYYQEQPALAVGLINLSAAKQNNGVLLKWQTTTEENSDHFNIQRSTDGVNFVTIGSQKAGGNSTSLLNYSYLDNSPNINLGVVNYYRLEEADADQQVKYSNIVSINPGTQEALFKILPNPVRSLLTIQSGKDAPHAAVSIFDANGRIVYSSVQALYASAVTQLNVSSIAAGVYFLKIDTGDNTATIKIVKE